MAAVQETVEKVKSVDVDAYKYGFVSEIESEKAPKGLNEDIVRFISAKKNEPAWLTEWRLEAAFRCASRKFSQACKSVVSRLMLCSTLSLSRRPSRLNSPRLA